VTEIVDFTSEIVVRDFYKHLATLAEILEGIFHLIKANGKLFFCYFNRYLCL
jgi:2-polyprenyl-3-methyl-5-hydroxy-6-metoxy-1,4-benzoquinol methylase